MKAPKESDNELPIKMRVISHDAWGWHKKRAKWVRIKVVSKTSSPSIAHVAAKRRKSA